jgi:soluble lytic murein transglycosylase-like protein
LKAPARQLGQALQQIGRILWASLRRDWKTWLKRGGLFMGAAAAAWLFVSVEIRFNDAQTIARRAETLGGLGMTAFFVYSSTPPMFAAADKAALRHGLDPMLFRALITQESGWNPQAVSAKGAAGLTQLMADTAREDCGMTPEERFEIDKNLECGAQYLAKQVRRFGSVDLALAAYNAGPERVAKLGRVPKIPETQEYVTRILVNWSSANGGTRL